MRGETGSNDGTYDVFMMKISFHGQAFTNYVITTCFRHSFAKCICQYVNILMVLVIYVWHSRSRRGGNFDTEVRA